MPTRLRNLSDQLERLSTSRGASVGQHLLWGLVAHPPRAVPGARGGDLLDLVRCRGLLLGCHVHHAVSNNLL